jgi:hypothetical protein
MNEPDEVIFFLLELIPLFVAIFGPEKKWDYKGFSLSRGYKYVTTPIFKI